MNIKHIEIIKIVVVIVIVMIVLIPVGVVIVISNFFATNKFIMDTTIKTELFNAVTPYTFITEGWYYEELPENFVYEENNVYITIVEKSGKDFIAVGYYKNNVNNQFCYDSRTQEIESCSLAPIA